jgi:hypothetical protein
MLKKEMKLGHKTPYFDKNKKRLCLGDDVIFENQGKCQIRYRYGRWAISPIGALCYFMLSEYSNKNKIVKTIKKIDSITMTVGLMCQELVKN